MPTTRSFVSDELSVEVYPTEPEMGRAAASRAAALIRDAVAERGSARVVIATGNSQYEFTSALVRQDVPWESVTVFHMDEYIGIDSDHPASFQRWIRERIAQRVPAHRVEYISGKGDPESEAARYEALLREAPLDLVCMGIGENGHLAFNEPFDADFDDERWARVITLTRASREQQVNEGHFPSVDDVPAQAISLTIPALLSARSVQICAPELRKAEAVRATLEDPVSPAVPSTRLRTAANALLLLDSASASLIAAPGERVADRRIGPSLAQTE